MKILIEEYAQVSAELILIFGGIIVIAIIALLAYNHYLHGLIAPPLMEVTITVN